MKTKHQTPNTKHQMPNTKHQTPMWRNSPEMLSVFARIADERIRQKQLLAMRKIALDCAGLVPDGHRKLSVLSAQVGDVAKSLGRLDQLRDRRGERFVMEDLQDELTHVAAVAVAWLESLETQKYPNTQVTKDPK